MVLMLLIPIQLIAVLLPVLPLVVLLLTIIVLLCLVILSWQLLLPSMVLHALLLLLGVGVVLPVGTLGRRVMLSSLTARSAGFLLTHCHVNMPHSTKTAAAESTTATCNHVYKQYTLKLQLRLPVLADIRSRVALQTQ